MAAKNLGDIEVGEALPVGFAVDQDITGATVEGRIAVNGGAAQVVAGVLDAPVSGQIKSGLVPFAGTLFTSQGYAEGVITVAKAGQVWSPAKTRFHVRIFAAV